MPTLTKRMIIKFGRSGLVITIPKSWAEFYQVKPGDKFEVIANGGLRVRLKTQRKRQASDIHDNESDSEH